MKKKRLVSGAGFWNIQSLTTKHTKISQGTHIGVFQEHTRQEPIQKVFESWLLCKWLKFFIFIFDASSIVLWCSIVQKHSAYTTLQMVEWWPFCYTRIRNIITNFRSHNASEHFPALTLCTQIQITTSSRASCAGSRSCWEIPQQR